MSNIISRLWHSYMHLIHPFAGPGLMKTQLHRQKEDAKTCKAFKDYDWWLWQISFSDVLVYSKDLHAQSHGFLHRYFPLWVKTKSNQQLFVMTKLGVADKVSDTSVWLLPLPYGETGYMMVKLKVSDKDACISKSQTVLIDSCWCISFWNWKKRATKARSRASKWELGCAMLEILGTTQNAVVPPSTMHPKHSLDGAMGEEMASLWATAWSHPPRCSHRPQ